MALVLISPFFLIIVNIIGHDEIIYEMNRIFNCGYEMK